MVGYRDVIILCIGDITIFDGLSYTMIHDRTFTLTCISTGGPATTITWTRDSDTVTEGTETVLDDPVTAQYTHTLTVTGRLPGLYTCTVTNNKPSSDSASLIVRGNTEHKKYQNDIHSRSAPSPPSGVSVSQNGPGSLLVSWTPPPSGGATVTGYTIYYLYSQTLYSVMAKANVTSATITGLIAGVTYSINVVANSSTLPSIVTTAPGVTIGI